MRPRSGIKRRSGERGRREQVYIPAHDRILEALARQQLTSFKRLVASGGPVLAMDGLVALLERNGRLKPITLKSADYSDLKRYVWGSVSPYQVALSVKNAAFLSHGTAAFLHDITDQLPSTIFVNAEQSPKLVKES